MYAIIKSGVYIQGVYLVDSLLAGKAMLVNKVNEDSDNYHRWGLVEVIGSEDIADAPVLYTICKPVRKGELYWKEGGGRNPAYYREATTQDLIFNQQDEEV